jgi:hypothetical protein
MANQNHGQGNKGDKATKGGKNPGVPADGVSRKNGSGHASARSDDAGTESKDGNRGGKGDSSGKGDGTH